MPPKTKAERNEINRNKRAEFGETYSGERQYQLEWYHENKARFKTEEWYEHIRVYSKEYHKKKSIEQKERELELHLLRKYKMTLQEFRDLEKKQNYLCKICRRKELKNPRLSVDHCHKTGKVRGLLCQPCNIMLGVYEQAQDALGFPPDIIGYLK